MKGSNMKFQELLSEVAHKKPTKKKPEKAKTKDRTDPAMEPGFWQGKDKSAKESFEEDKEYVPPYRPPLKKGDVNSGQHQEPFMTQSLRADNDKWRAKLKKLRERHGIPPGNPAENPYTAYMKLKAKLEGKK